MNAEEMAEFHALAIKDGVIKKWEAVMYFRNRHPMDYVEALLTIDIAIGNINEGIYINEDLVFGC